MTTILNSANRSFIYDLKTKNVSFKQTAADLNKLGVKNNLFMLALYDRDLQGVDPFSPLLPQQTIIKIINECIINPWYFLREIARIPEQGGTSCPFMLHRGNLAQTFLFINGIDSYITIPRQKGKTQSILSILDWTFLLGTTNSEFLFGNIKEEGAINNLNRLKAQRDLLPKYLQGEFAFDDSGKMIKGSNSNVKSLINFGNNNKIVVAPAATSQTKADSIGRGYTQPIQYFDEVEFINHIATILEAAGPAFAKAASNAKKNGAVYGRLFSSTPGDLDSGPGREAMQILEHSCRFTEKMYDIFAEEGREGLEEYVRCNSSNGIVYIEFHYYQLGEDENWFYEMCRVVNNKPEKIKRELLLQRISGSANSPFSPEDLMALEEHITEPISELFIMPNYKIDLYEEINKQKCYFVGVDPSSGYGQDNSAVVIIDPYTFKIVGEFKSPYIGVTTFTKFLRLLILKHIPRGILCIERNYGEGIISALRESDVRHALYFDHNKDLLNSTLDDKLDAQGLLKLEAARRKLYGVYTQRESRKIMFQLLDKYMNECKSTFRGRNVIDDIKKLVIKNGKIQADAGMHDDSIMAFLIAAYVITYGSNLKRFGYYKGEFIPDEYSAPEDTVDEINSLLENMPELQKLFGKAENVQTSDDYSRHIMEQIQHNRQLATNNTYTDSNGARITTESYNEVSDDDFMSNYESLDASFFDELNN